MGTPPLLSDSELVCLAVAQALLGAGRSTCGDRAAVPAQDGARGDQPVHPQPRRQEPDQRGKDRAVGPVQPGPGIGAAQHGDLVPQHQQLCILRPLTGRA